jgi:hypothetical protein
MANSCPTENGRMNNLTGANIAVFSAGLPISIQALPKVAEAIAPAAVAVISELPLPWRK